MKNDCIILTVKDVRPLGRDGQAIIIFKQRSVRPYETSISCAQKFNKGMKVCLKKGKLSIYNQ